MMATLSDRILTTLEQLGTECPLEEVMDLCPDITWNQVFLAIDYLSRTGQICVRLDAGKTYWVQTSDRAIDRTSNSPVGSMQSNIH